MRFIVGIAFGFFCNIFNKTNEWETSLLIFPLIIIYTHARELIAFALSEFVARVVSGVSVLPGTLCPVKIVFVFITRRDALKPSVQPIDAILS